MDLDFHFSTCSVLACCCLWLSNTVTLNDCFPACYPFPNRVCEMCSAKNRRQVPPTATFSCSTSNWVLPSNIKPHSSSPKAFTLDKRPLWIKRPWHQRPRHVKAVWNFLGQSLAASGWHLSQFRGAWVGWGELGLHKTENLTFKALISFKRFAWSKRQAILSPSSIFFSCCSHYKSTSKRSPPLTICCIVS